MYDVHMGEHEFFDDSGENELPPREELAVWLSEFMAASADAENRYRAHYCAMLVEKLYEEFGVEGFCEMMMAMDKKAGWISDIILESSDLDDILFKKHGVYDKHALAKARASTSMDELNGKIWKLRRRYAKAIVDEIVVSTAAKDAEGEEGEEE
jgi:hypothetical protein